MGFHSEKIKNEHLGLNGNTYYLHHILELDLTLGKMGIMIVKIKLVRHLKEENVQKKFIQHIEKCKQIYITFNPLLVKLMD